MDFQYGDIILALIFLIAILCSFGRNNNNKP